MENPGTGTRPGRVQESRNQEPGTLRQNWRINGQMQMKKRLRDIAGFKRLDPA